MEDILEELFTLLIFSGDNKKGGCWIPIVILLIIVALCVGWYYFM